MLEALNDFDHSLFLSIHHWRNTFLDVLMPVITNRWIWIPLYALFLFIIWKRFGKQTIVISITIVLLIVASDQAANLLKKNTGRLRPCHEEALSGMVTTPLGCGGNYGFVSGHAANSCAIAVFLWLLSGTMHGFAPSRKRNWWLLLFPWVILVCWSRIYLGVHFPFDLLGGCIIGTACAFLLFFLYKKAAPVMR